MNVHASRLAVVVALLSLTTSLAAAEPGGGPSELKRLKFRSIGPAAGGRVCRAAGVPGDPLTYYAATAGGGVWKSSDGGIRWKPIFDKQLDSSAGSLAIAPSDPNVIYVGAGEANIRGNVEVGHGIYKSTDAGKTWKHVWKQEGQIGTMIVHPTNPDVAYAAVLGHAFGPNPERGVYRTTDGGKTWQRVLAKNADTGACDICFDPTNPRILFAGLWQVRRRPWSFSSGGPGSGLYTSRDGGDTWTHLVPPPGDKSPDAGKEAPKGTRFGKGLPEGIWGKIGLAIAPSDSRRIYALIEAEKGGLFRSDDGGENWQLINAHRGLRQRAWYFFTLTVDPRNPNVVWFPQVPLLKSIDGGKTLRRVKGPHHGDHHDIWIDPKDPRRIIDSNDGGVDISINGGETWFAPPLPLGQFYHVSADNRLPYHVAGTMQDIGTASGPSNSLSTRGIPLTAWHGVGGGETGFTAPDPVDPNIVYAGEYGGYISRYNHRTRQAQSIGVYPFNPSGHAAADLEYRFQWTAPILVSRHDHRMIYHAANVLFRTANAGKTWEPISPDLTRNDKSKQKWSGGPITGDNTGVEVYGTIYALAESPKRKGLLWVGSDDGLVHVSRNGGKDWTNLTPHIKGLPEWGTVRCIEPSPFDADTAYVVVDAHKLDDRRPYLFKTTDGGKSWKGLASKLPATGYLHVVREDPKRRGLLYLGGERSLFISRDGGDAWISLKLNLPSVTVTDLVVKHNDLVVGTNGRSIWILDDLTALRDLSPEVLAKDVALFPALPAIRYRYHHTIEEGARLGSGANPPQGAILHYYLKTKPRGEITLVITDAKGQLVQTLTSKTEKAAKDQAGDYDADEYKPTILPTDPGLHRIVWDLRYKGADVIKGARIDGGKPRIGPLVNPGIYTLKLTVEGKTLTTKLEVLHDLRTLPISVVSSAIKMIEMKTVPAELLEALRHVKPLKFSTELDEQLKLALTIRDEISSLTHTVEGIRSVRKQLLARNELLAKDPKAAAFVKASKALVERLDELEEKMHNPKAQVNYDILAQKGGAKLYSQLAWLFELLKDSDGAPTQGIRKVHVAQAAQLRRYQSEWLSLRKGGLTDLNEQARKLDLPGVILPPTAGKPKR